MERFFQSTARFPDPWRELLNWRLVEGLLPAALGPALSVEVPVLREQLTLSFAALARELSLEPTEADLSALLDGGEGGSIWRELVTPLKAVAYAAQAPLPLALREVDPARAQRPERDWLAKATEEQRAAEPTSPMLPLPVAARPKSLLEGWRPLAIGGLYAALAVAMGVLALALPTGLGFRRGSFKPVLTSAAELPAGARVMPEMFRVREVPAELVTASVVPPARVGETNGLKLRTALQVGDPLLWTHLLAPEKPAHLSDRVHSRLRAVTLEVLEAAAVGRQVLPGDRVDLIAVVHQGTALVDTTVLQDLPVLSVGQQVERQDDRGEVRHFSTVTLTALPEEVERVVLTQDTGLAWLTLRQREDHLAAQTHGARAATLRDSRGAARTLPAPPLTPGADDGGARWRERTRPDDAVSP